MKQLFLSIFVLFFANIAIFSQPIIFMGLKGGTINSTLETEGVLGNINPKYSFDGGIISEFSFISNKTGELARLTLIIEANYVKNIFRDNTFRGLEFKNNFETNLFYAQMPVMLRFYTGFLGVKKTGIYIDAGGYGSYLFKAQHFGNITLNEVEQEINENVLSDYLVYDYGFSFGGGISMAGFIGIDFRYNIGIPDIYLDKNVLKKNTNWGFFLHLAWPINYKEEY